MMGSSSSSLEPSRSAGRLFPLLGLIGLLLALNNSHQYCYCHAQVIISEIADKGSSSACGGGTDWVELYNTNDAAAVVDLSVFILHDDNGIESDNAFVFAEQGQAPELAAGEYLVLCAGGDGDDGDETSSPQFKVGGGDTITLVNAATQEIVSSVALPNGPERNFDVSHAWNGTAYSYTSTPTPGAANVITPVVEETTELIKERLTRQNAQGRQFFGMDDNGLPVADGMGAVLDLHLTMEQADYDYMMQNASFQMYSPFTSARVVRNNTNDDGSTAEEEELIVLNSPGRLRPKGQSTVFVSNCLGTESMPFLVEFNTNNQTQTLFGVERLYLRMHLEDNSNMREWAAHRMLARFGLPHLRARTMRLFINGERIGLYTVMEAVEQEYVFHRSFPNYNPDDYALYKVKTLSLGCGGYSQSRLEAAQVRMESDDDATPPYVFERGDHREPTLVRGDASEEVAEQCFRDFFASIFEEFADVELAYLRANEDCGKMLVQLGLIDRDLGSKDWDVVMEEFINENLADNACDDQCQNSALSEEVDIDNFLKHFAFYASTLLIDSPIFNGNNYYLAETGDGTGWKIVGFDHNIRGGSLCDDSCNAHLPHWSILRPTCGALEENQLVGPLLTNATLHAQYVEYVREFTNAVLANTSFIEELMQHAAAIEPYVKEDYWSYGGQFFFEELSPDAADWNSTHRPLLPFYKARVESIEEQLKAHDEGTFVRGPHLDKDVAAYEQCVDWRSTATPESKCPQGCLYDGCHREGTWYFSFCNEESGICYQGEMDEKCANITTGEKYDGMQDMPDGRATFCQDSVLKMSECPPLVVDDGPPVVDDNIDKTTSPEPPMDDREDENGETDTGTSGTKDAGTNSSSSSTRLGKFQIIITFVLFASSWMFV